MDAYIFKASMFTFDLYLCTLLFINKKNFCKKLIVLFSKGALNGSKVRVNTFIMLQKKQHNCFQH